METQNLPLIFTTETKFLCIFFYFFKVTFTIHAPLITKVRNQEFIFRPSDHHINKDLAYEHR